MISPPEILADYSQSSCPSGTWKWFPGLVVPSPFQELRWGWPACSSLNLLSCPSGATFAVFQPWGTSASHYGLPKVTVSGLAVTVGSLCTREFNPSGPSSQVLGLLKRSLTWSSSTTSKSALFHTSLLVSQGPGSTEGWCCWQRLSQRRHLSTSAFCL